MKIINQIKQSFLNISIFIIFFLLSLFVSEGIVRLLGFNPMTPEVDLHELSPFYGYQGKPDMKTVVIGPEYKISVIQNSKGLRDDGKTYTKNKGIFRILVLGDSFMWGIGVPQDRIFPKQLENNLKAMGVKAEVINSGVASYSATPELLWLENEGIKYKPDLVLLAFYTGNDVETPDFRPLYQPYFIQKEDGKLKLENYPASMEEVQKFFWKNKKSKNSYYWKNWLLHHSALCALVKSVAKTNPELMTFMVKTGMSHKENTSIDNPLLMYKDYKTSSWERNFKWTAKLIEKMKEVSNSQGSAFLVMIVPEKYRIDKKAWQSTKILFSLNSEYDPDGPASAMMEEFEKNGIEAIDLAPILRKDASRKFYFRLDNHWNTNGHEKAAAEISDYVSKMKLKDNNPEDLKFQEPP